MAKTGNEKIEFQLDFEIQEKIAEFDRKIELLKEKLKQLNNELKVDAKNVELLGEKNKVLAQLESNAAQKTGLLNSKLARGIKDYSATDKAVQKVQLRLEKAKTAQSKFAAEHKEAAKAIEEVSLKEKEFTQKIREADDAIALEDARLEDNRYNTKLLETQKSNLINKEKLLNEAISNLKNGLTQSKKATGENSEAAYEYKNKLAGLEIELAKTKNKIEGLSKAVQSAKFDKLSAKFGSIGSSLTGVANAFRGLSTGAGSALKGMVSTAEKFESAFAGVKKTLEDADVASAYGANGFEKLRKELLKISTVTASTPEEIFAVAEAAGQLGVKAKDVKVFTETMIKLGDTTTMTANEAATQISRLGNILNITGDDYKRLGAVIVDLGNNAAATEEEISNVLQRWSAMGHIVGMTTPQITAIGTAMVSVGIRAENAGTSMMTTLTQMEKAAAEGGKKLENFAHIAGMSADEFKEKWETNATGALLAFLKGLRDADKQGESAILLLNEAGITQKRQTQTLLSMAQAYDKVAEFVGRADTAWSNALTSADALEIEAAKRYDTFETAVIQFKSALEVLGDTLGRDLMPELKDLLNETTDLIVAFSEMPKPVRKLISGTLILTASITPVLGLLGAVSTNVGELFKNIGKLSSTKGVAGLVGKFNKLRTVMAATVNPTGILISGGIAMAAVLYEGIKAKTQDAVAEDELYKRYLRTAEARKQSVKDVQTQIESASSYIDMIDELNKKEHLSAEEKERMKLLVASLNEETGETIATINAETGKVNESINAIRKRINALKEEALAEAYAKNYKDAISEQVKAELDLVEAEKKLAKYRAEAAKNGIDPAEQGKINELTIDVEALQRAYKKAGDEADYWTDKIVNGNSTAKKSAKETSNALEQEAGKMSRAGKNAGDGYASGLNQGMSKTHSVGKQGAKNAVKGADSEKGNMRSSGSSIGSNLTKGIWSGMDGKFSWLVSQIKSFANNVKNKLKAFFGIKSPSRWARDMIGANLAYGIGIGFEKTLPSVNKDMAGALSTTMSKLQTANLKAFETAVGNTYGITANAQNSISVGFDYDRLADAIGNRGIYLNGRLVGRELDKIGVVMA